MDLPCLKHSFETLRPLMKVLNRSNREDTRAGSWSRIYVMSTILLYNNDNILPRNQSS
jgi:hypothetical protein